MPQRRFHDCSLMFVTIALILAASVVLAQPAAIHIPDSNLQNALREALNLPAGSPITEADMRQLTSLNAKNRQITDLTGLEYATNLTELRLGENPIKDISPLAGLTQLTLLRLNDCWTIDDISPLAHLTQLQVLDLDRNLIVDIGPLAGLTALTSLDLRYNQIENVGPLANLTQLTRLLLNNNRIVDISPLEKLTNLEQLDTHENPIFDPNSPLVDIPDPNLRVAIRDVLTLPDEVPLTQASMGQLTRLDARNKQITTLSGLEHALNLTELNLAENNISDLGSIVSLLGLRELHLGDNQIEDISPLANLTQLTYLRLNDNWRIKDIGSLANLTQLQVVHLDRNEIVDVSPLARLTNLEELDLRHNRIMDVDPLANLTQLPRLLLNNNRILDASPLANLTQLVELLLNNNRIVDVSPLANLTRLAVLEIRRNKITDFSALNGLSLTHLIYDQRCDMPQLPLAPRIENRNYPSIVARWGPRNPELHDLWFGAGFTLYFHDPSKGIVMAGPLDLATQLRDEYLAFNPNMVFLVDIRMREYWAHAFPEDWPYWVRDASGNVVSHWPGANLVDFTHPYIQDRIVQQAIAVSKCGLFDGIFFDYWSESIQVLGGFRTMEAEQLARENIIQRIRAATGPDFLIMGNTNVNIIPRTGPHINGGFMETGIPEIRTGADLERAINAAENALIWLEHNLREPRINALEGYSLPDEPLDSPNNIRWMRALTTLSLTHSDGYVLYSESVFSENPTGNIWYDFWDADLGQTVGPKAQLYDERTPGLYIREFTNGWAVYNHSGTEQTITLPELSSGVASGREGTEHTLPNLDGEMYLRVTPKNAADVNGDGVVNIFDLTLVAQAFGKDGLQGDVNGDGVVNVFDLVFVAGEIQ